MKLKSDHEELTVVSSQLEAFIGLFNADLNLVQTKVVHFSELQRHCLIFSPKLSFNSKAFCVNEFM